MLAIGVVVGLFWTALTLAAPLPAANTFVVSSSGGNITSPYAYGIMFEVQKSTAIIIDKS